MVTPQQAREVALTHARLAWLDVPPEDELVLISEATIERSWGWVFFLSSKLWLESRDIRYALAGNSPLLVERTSGKVFETGTAWPVDHYISNYERTGRVHG